MTGGDSGIGRAVAVMMAKEKAKAVAIVYLPKEQHVGWAGLGWASSFKRQVIFMVVPVAIVYLPKEQHVGWAGLGWAGTFKLC